MLRPGPAIIVRGAWAELRGANVSVLAKCLSVDDPKRFFNQAFKDGRWDGKIRLYEGKRFPAGLVGRVVQAYRDEGFDAGVHEPDVPVTDVSRFTPDYFVCLGPDGDSQLWAHQHRAVVEMLTHRRGIVKSPTASGKTPMIAAVARYLWEEHGYRTLIVVPKKGLAEQTTRVLRGIYAGDLSVGQCGDGKRESGAVIVATAQTLIGFEKRTRRKKVVNPETGKKDMTITEFIPPDELLQDIVHNYEVLILDETHHASSETWYTISMASGAVRRYGLSGTPLKDSELLDLRMVGATGQIIYSVDANELIDLGLAAKPKIAMVVADGASSEEIPDEWVDEKDEETGEIVPVLQPPSYESAYTKGVVFSKPHNTAVVRATMWLVDRGRRTLVLCRRKDHFLDLKEILSEYLDEESFACVWGATDVELRLEVKEALNKSHIKVILATTIFDEGEDIPGIEAIVLAEGVKAVTNAIQRIGRGMRMGSDSAKDVWVVDFAPCCNHRLLRHALKREEAYLSEGYEVQEVTEWPSSDVPISEYKDDNLLPFLTWETSDSSE